MQAILALNSGSSSIKFALYASEENKRGLFLLCRGKFEGLPRALHFLAYNDKRTLGKGDIKGTADFNTALKHLLSWAKQNFPQVQLIAAGHRVVHGGERYVESVGVTQEVLTYLESLDPLAPLHQPHNLAGIRALQSLHPTLFQVACFDTSFHHTQSPLATLFGLPLHFWDEGVRRYGFHGLSYRYVAEKLPELIGEKSRGRVVVAHLGHGASLCALKDLKSVATTMGLTALDGLPMGTRCGSIDPGVILYLLSQKGYSLQGMLDLLYNKSGLLGLSGISDDMQELLKSKTPQATQAIDYFCYHIQRDLGSLVAALQGLDVLIFTGGIGENEPLIRQKVCEGLGWLNIKLNERLNCPISPAEAFSINHSEGLPIWVIPTNEEIIIVKDTLDLAQKT
jgi:acetate kinase